MFYLVLLVIVYKYQCMQSIAQPSNTSLLTSLAQSLMESRFFSSLVTFLVLSSLSLSPWLAFAGRPATSGEQKCCFPAIFNFGDSNSDTGGLSAVFGQAPPPHGMTFFGGPAGRYCDGRVIVDFIGK